MTNPLPQSLQPTDADRARDAQLAREAEALLSDTYARTGMRVKWNTETYNAVQFGPDGSIVSRIRNGVPLQTAAEEAVARAQADANGEIMRMEKELQRLTAMHDEVTGYGPDGTPKYARSAAARESLAGEMRFLQLGIINQKRLNERRWREAAAPGVRRAEELAELSRQLEAQGKGRRTSW